MKFLLNNKNRKTNKRDSEFTKMKSDITNIKKFFTQMMAQKQYYSPGKMDSLKAQDPSTMVPTNKKYQPLEVGHSKKIGGMRTRKHEIR